MKRFISTPAQRWRLVTFLLCLIMLISMVTPGVSIPKNHEGTLIQRSYILLPAVVLFGALSVLFSLLSVFSNINALPSVLVINGVLLWVFYRCRAIPYALSLDPVPILPFVPPLLAIVAILTSIIAWICQRKKEAPQ